MYCNSSLGLSNTSSNNTHPSVALSPIFSNPASLPRCSSLLFPHPFPSPWVALFDLCKSSNFKLVWSTQKVDNLIHQLWNPTSSLPTISSVSCNLKSVFPKEKRTSYLTLSHRDWSDHKKPIVSTGGMEERKEKSMENNLTILSYFFSFVFSYLFSFLYFLMLFFSLRQWT